MTKRSYERNELEQAWVEERRAQKEADVAAGLANNKALIGDAKTYKGIRYQMTNMAHIVCPDFETSHPVFGGMFTSAQALTKIIDDLDKLGKLPKAA